VIRVTRYTSGDDKIVVRVGGDLNVETLPELVSSVQAGGDARRVEIDVSEVRSLDAGAREYLRLQRNAGSTLVGGSLYVKMLLMETEP